MGNFDELVAKIRGRTAGVAVIGLGYVDLPLAVLYSQAGFKVHGIERNPDRVAQVNQGRSYIGEVTDHDLMAAVGAGRLSATSGFSCISTVDMVNICVPTPVDKNKQPDTSYIEHVVEQAQPYWHPGQLIVLESTTYPGTTEEVILPRLKALGFDIGQDIFLKIDVEGAEPLVLAGMAGLFDRSLDPVMFVELNPTALREAGNSPEDLQATLDRLGFDAIAPLDEERGADGELQLCNFYCRRKQVPGR